MRVICACADERVVILNRTYILRSLSIAECLDKPRGTQARKSAEEMQGTFGKNSGNSVLK